ncbi:MAG: carboxymuconolactone decarboxylase family protein [Deltaproteobacteria bacterium]|nr:carboxymuconolactone decarboxylase family protein [Deltaproteobacteria bacterium]
MSKLPDVEEGRRHIERFRAPASVRQELTEFITTGGSLAWTRPGLTPAQRSLATISVLVARGNLGPLREHLEIGLGNGLTESEMCEVILHCSIYAGFPQTISAMEVAADFFDGA